MSHFLHGMTMGLALSILVGPILFALVQTSLERGIRAGLAVGLGIWVSDLLFIWATYSGLSYVMHIAEWSAFEETLGTVGGVFLIGVGLAAMLRREPGRESRPVMGSRLAGLGSLGLKGFLVNTFNPFTVFFWISVATSLLLEEGDERGWLFYPGIMLVIVATDAFKVVAAKAVRPYLKPRNILLVRRISGLAILVFGAALAVRVWLT